MLAPSKRTGAAKHPNAQNFHSRNPALDRELLEKECFQKPRTMKGRDHEVKIST
ncbi:hypothetical protein J6590_090610 [Homalodisca vitripennis]|nr:hypothetical protein J6590_090610 [Homalodisca vitripennis]